jgi:methionine-rich copper-binding protein CopC
MPTDYRPVSPRRAVAGATTPDDFGNTAATATAVAVGATVSGKIETVGDVDLFKVQLAAGKLYSFTMQGLDDSGRIKNMAMTFSDAGGAVHDALTVGPTNTYSFIPAVTGSYYVGAAATDGAGLLGYTFKASEALDDFGSTIATAGHLDIGGTPAWGALDAGGGDRDWFAMSLVAGTSYLFSVEGSASGWGTLPSGPTGLARLAIFDAAGNEVAQDSSEHSYLSNAPVLPFTAPADGTYYLGVSAVRNGAGAGGGTYAVLSRVAPADEAGDDMAHAVALPLDTVVHGTVAVNTDKDVYKLSLVAGTTYVLDRVQTDAPSGVFLMDAVLTDSAGQVVAPMPTSSTHGRYFVFTAVAGGDYYLSLSGPFGTLEDHYNGYALKLTAAASDDLPSSVQTSALLDLANPVHGVLEQQYDKDWVRVHLQAGEKYAFELQGGSLDAVHGTVFTLLTDHGARVSDYDQAGLRNASVIVYTAASTGDYYLDVEGYQGELYNGGDYTLTAHLLTGDAAAPVLQSASFAPGGTGVPVKDGIEFTFDEAVRSSTDAVLTNSRGEKVAAAYGPLEQTFGNKMVIDPYWPLESGMTYTLTLGDIKDLAGNAYTGPKVYTFTTAPSSPDDYTADISTAGVLTAGTPAAANFEAVGDADWFKFHAAGGKNYLATGATKITIHDAAGHLLAADALLNLPVAGDYYLGFANASQGPFGAYNASVKEVADDYTADNTAPGQLAVGGQLGGAIDYAGDADRIKITLAAGAVYKITLTNNEPASLNGLTLALRDPGGAVLAVDHFGAAVGTQSFLVVAPASGSYALDVTDAYATERPRGYTIAATAVTDDYGNSIAAAASQPLDKVLSGTVQSPGDKDMFSFDLNAGSTYRATLVATLAGVAVARWTLLDSKGVAVGPSSTQDQSFTAKTTGKYYLEVSNPDTNGATYDNWSRGYALKMAAITDDFGASNATAGKLAVGATVAGKLESGGGDSDWFAVTLDAGTTYAFWLKGTMQGLNGQPGEAPVRLLDASGKQLAIVDHAVGTDTVYPPIYYTATAKGTYYVDVGMGNSGLAGDYTLRAVTVAADDFGNDNAHAAKLADGVLTNGKLEQGSDKDVFKVSLAAGAVVSVEFGSPLAAGVKMTMTDSAGKLVGGSSALTDTVNGLNVTSAQYKATAAGDYFLTVSTGSASLPPTAYTVKATLSAPDDYAGDASTAGVLAAGKALRGVIGVGGDSDWFKAHLEAGHSYTFTLQNGGGTLATSGFGQAASAGIELYAADGSRVATTLLTGSADVGVSLASVATGDYFVSVHGNAYQTGSYTLLETAKAIVIPGDEYGDDNAHAAKLADGVVANGKLQAPIDRDVFKISLAEGALVTVDFGAPAGVAVKMTVTDSGGHEIKGALHHADTVGGVYLDSAQYLAGAAGDYYVTVASGNAQLPLTAYSVKATIAGADDFAGDDSTEGVLAAAKAQKGMIGVAGDADWFKAHLEAGHSYSFALQSGGTLATTGFGSAGGPGIDLYAADGSRVATTVNTAEAGVSVAGLATGDYFVGVHGNVYQTGSYVLLETAKPTVTPGDDYGDARETAAALTLGKGISGVLATIPDIDMFKVDLAAGTSYTFDGALSGSPASAVQLSLMAADGSPVYSAYDEAAVSYSYTPAASGSYYLAVTDSMKLVTGASYTLKASATPDDYGATAATVGKLVLGPTASGTVSGKLDAGGGDRDWFAIALDKNGQYTFTLDGATGHEGRNTDEQGGATLRLLDATGKVLGEVLAAGGSAALAYVPDTKGAYFLEVAGGDGHATGAYKLSAVNDTDDYAGDATTKGTLAPAAPAQGMVAGPGDLDWFKVHLDGGKTYVFDLKGVKGHGGTLDTGAEGTGLSLFDPAGKTQLAAADGPSEATGETQLTYKAQATGDFFVSAYAAAKGSYTLAESLGAADVKAPQLTASSVADGASGVGLGSKILLTFDDAIAAGTGIRLTDEHGATLSSVVVTASGNTLKIDPHQNLTPGTRYTLSLPEGSVLDLSGNHYAGHANYTFTTVAPASSSAAGNGNDVFSGNGTGQKIDGGAGTDTVFYDDTKVPLEIYARDGQITVYQTGAGTADILTGVERLVFPSHAMAFDVDGNGGQAYRLYQAAFNRKPGEGLGFWMNALDVGAKLETIAQNFIDSAEFKTLYGDAPSNADFVTHLYSNVLHRAPLQAGYDFWLHGLEAGATRAQILINFSESAENHAALQPLIGQGFSYTPYG